MGPFRAADGGWNVTAVDARDTRFPTDERITWVHQDVREADLTGYELILCLGLWYHLIIDDQLSLLQRMAGTPMILDPHVATDQPTKQLSDAVEESGYASLLLRAGLADAANRHLEQHGVLLADTGKPLPHARRARLPHGLRRHPRGDHRPEPSPSASQLLASRSPRPASASAGPRSASHPWETPPAQTVTEVKRWTSHSSRSPFLPLRLGNSSLQRRNRPFRMQSRDREACPCVCTALRETQAT